LGQRDRNSFIWPAQALTGPWIPPLGFGRDFVVRPAAGSDVARDDGIVAEVRRQRKIVR
jgi:hypothetical protein